MRDSLGPGFESLRAHHLSPAPAVILVHSLFIGDFALRLIMLNFMPILFFLQFEKRLAF